MTAAATTATSDADSGHNSASPSEMQLQCISMEEGEQALHYAQGVHVRTFNTSQTGDYILLINSHYSTEYCSYA